MVAWQRTVLVVRTAMGGSNDQNREPPPRPAWACAGLVLAGLVAVVTVSGASVAAPGASRPAKPAIKAAHTLPQLPFPPDLLAPAAPATPAAPRGATRLPAKPVHVDRPAPATKPVIAALATGGIPAIALNAYRVAAARMASADPSCGIGWPLLAAIGRVESNHGRFGGATLAPNGESAPRIIGIALDGTRSAYIGDTDGGRLDGDTRYDHAVGPMQFIPSTWASWATDGNGDGVADPFNIDDAALAAARYLCAAGGNLRTDAGRVAAVLAYNDSDEYLAQVLALARSYALGVPVGNLPISGQTRGALPPVQPGAGLPVNPAAPPAGATHAPAAHATVTPPASEQQPTSAPAAPAPTSTPRGAVPGSASTPTPSAPASKPTPAPSRPAGPTPTPGPLQTVVNGVLCTVSLLGLPVCPTGP